MSQPIDAAYFPLTAVDTDPKTGFDAPVKIFLHYEKQSKLPIQLGTGRSAVVLLASKFPDLQHGGDYYAVKFLRDDPDPQYREASSEKFFTEALQMREWGRGNAAIVSYEGWGAIAKNIEKKNTRNEPAEYWWVKSYFSKYDVDASDRSATVPVLNNNSAPFPYLKEALNLQGPFYILKLCQATLEDLLERDMPWEELTVYRTINRYGDHLKTQRDNKEIASDIRSFRERYLSLSNFRRSGYSILNSFKIDEQVSFLYDGKTVTHNPNFIRNHAVLELFNQIVATVARLHQGRDNSNSLAHRDLKPGNIFLDHPYDGPQQVQLRLADLGYVISAPTLISSMSLYIDRRGVEYQAPGSQFYRAPEQAELPIEVWVQVNPQQRTQVKVRGTKLSNIQPNDWLIIDDIITDILPKDSALEETRDVSNDADRTSVSPIAPGVIDSETQILGDDPPKTGITPKDGALEETRDVSNDADRISVNPIAPGVIDSETQGLGDDPPKAATTGKATRLFRIIRVNPGASDSYYLTLNEAVPQRPDGKDHDLHAQIAKAAGFHTDGYSLGAILYDLISGGKNPEYFYTYCLRVFSSQFASRNREERFDSVDTITEVLRPEQKQTERLRLLRISRQRPYLKFDNRSRATAIALTAPNADALLDRIVDALYLNLDDKERNRKIRDLRFRHFHVVDELLRDKRGIFIDRAIIKLIVRCMLRDITGSFYNSDANTGYASDENTQASIRISEAVRELLEEERFGLPKEGIPDVLKKNMLFMLCYLIPSDQIEAEDENWPKSEEAGSSGSTPSGIRIERESEDTLQ